MSKVFGGVRALQSVSFDVAPGEVLCLAGENGCGKSTLIKIISGVYQPEPGAEMLFDGKPMEGLTPGVARSLGIQVIWQDLALFPEMTVAENIAFERNLGGRPRMVDYGEMRKVAAEMLGRLGVSIDLDKPVRELSIAQRQIVAICRALIAETRLVFMDEPTASPQPVGNRRAADDRAAAFGRWHRRRLRQPPAGGSAGGLQPRDGAARWPVCRDFPDRGHDPDPADRADDRPDLRP